MDKLIFTAVSGAERTLRSQQVHANNLANADTAGFRANLEVAATQAMQNGYGYDSMHLAKTDADTISTRAGAVRETGRPLDVAISGAGYLAVQFGEGEAYTRAGVDGTISVLTEGATLMQPVDKLRLVNAEGAELTKNEAGLIVSRDGNPLEADPNVAVRGRALEGSNVSAIEEMVAVMSLNRSFEMQMKMFKASDSMNEAGNRLIGA